MPKNTINNFFQKKNSETLGRSPASHGSQTPTPLGSATGNTLNRSHQTPAKAPIPKKRKASVDLDETPGRHILPKQAKVSDKTPEGRKGKLQALLGEGNTQENKIK